MVMLAAAAQCRQPAGMVCTGKHAGQYGCPAAGTTGTGAGYEYIGW
jgi:hypothetical protein